MINIRQWRFVLIAKTTQRRFGKWRNMPENCLVRNIHFSVPKVRTSGQVQNIHWSQFVCCTRTTHIKYYCSRFRPLVQSTQGQSPRAIPVVHCTMYCKAYTLYICGTMIMGCHFGGGGREGSTCMYILCILPKKPYSNKTAESLWRGVVVHCCTDENE